MTQPLPPQVEVAVKIVDIDNPAAQAALQRELGILGRLRHPCIVHLFGTVADAGEVMKACSKHGQ